MTTTRHALGLAALAALAATTTGRTGSTAAADKPITDGGPTVVLEPRIGPTGTGEPGPAGPALEPPYWKYVYQQQETPIEAAGSIFTRVEPGQHSTCGLRTDLLGDIGPVAVFEKNGTDMVAYVGALELRSAGFTATATVRDGKLRWKADADQGYTCDHDDFWSRAVVTMELARELVSVSHVAAWDGKGDSISLANYRKVVFTLE
jgi:hypothetical protein